MDDYSIFCAGGSSYTSAHVPGSDGVELFEIHFTPPKLSPFPPVIFLAGWESLIYSWEIVLKEMSKNFEVYYVETREKGSAIHPSEQELNIETLGNDLPHVLKHHQLADKEYILFGSSLGATVIMDAMSRVKVDPSVSVLVGPNAEFIAPWYWIWITKITPPFLFHPIRPLVKWYMKKKYFNMDADPQQYDKYARSLDEANPGRLRRSALQFAKYKIWDRLGKIHQKVLIFTGSKDALHGYENTVKMAEMLFNCDLIDLETNARTHSVEMVNQMRSNLKEINHV
ncbi:MAG: alpha/beta hydrolase [Candidatus Marinimicrobia bacterium]|jgi:pimeloyl-ACP methyl ester carboxylesterase|nr:alpha/beta hydrolase [Candidatus Neomarinimicrobiota bacterium]MDP6611445.1 alpha/beta hydrolase [Candidatus Neomarinimicrobiota bacterium]|tara:strand:- start:9553 stop:10404 length:852 start_codon:yes stop_codon:yes gene_type:complete